MSKTRINFIGCGKLGKTLAYLLSAIDEVVITGVVNQSYASALTAVKFIGNGTAYHTLKELPPADIYFITTRDDEIEPIAKQLHLPHNAIVVHCSGSLSSEILKITQCRTASIHPLKSFANPENDINDFANTNCAVEGDDEAVAVMTKLFEKIGARVFKIKNANKKLYHAASVMANNYLVTLHYHAMNAYVNSGIDPETAKKIVSQLMQNGLNNLNNLDHQASLTGPIQRGDVATIAGHIAALKNIPITQEIYAALGLGTLELTPHSESLKKVLQNILKP